MNTFNSHLTIYKNAIELQFLYYNSMRILIKLKVNTFSVSQPKISQEKYVPIKRKKRRRNINKMEITLEKAWRVILRLGSLLYDFTAVGRLIFPSNGFSFIYHQFSQKERQPIFKENLRIFFGKTQGDLKKMY